LLQQRKKAKSAVDRELDSSDVITNHRKDLAPQSVMLLFGVVDSIGVRKLLIVSIETNETFAEPLYFWYFLLRIDSEALFS
jgi:hypothetical protein